jgi:hypothetical protein
MKTTEHRSCSAFAGSSIIVIGFFFLSTLFPGCTSSRLANMWRDQSFTQGPMKDMLVVVIRNDAVRRRIWEDDFVAALTARGVKATASYRLFPSAVPDTDQISAAVQSHNYEGVLISHRLPTQTLTHDYPGYVTREPATRYHPLTKTYSTYYHDVEHPGFTDTTKVARNEVNIWTTTEGGSMVWAGTGETIDPLQGETRNNLVDMVIAELARQRLIP